jgi:hypothetical protein
LGSTTPFPRRKYPVVHAPKIGTSALVKRPNIPVSKLQELLHPKSEFDDLGLVEITRKILKTSYREPS